MMDADAVRHVVESCLAAGHFFVAYPRALHIDRVRDEDVAWEVFGGHLLDAPHSPEKRRFDAWHVELDARDAQSEPTRLISVYWDKRANQLAVVRYILTHGHEAYEDSPGVILSRPVQKWARELVGSIELAEIVEDEFDSELGALLFLAVIGVSRLPITSLESPLPGFSLGEFAYFPGLRSSTPTVCHDPVDVVRTALANNWQGVEVVKALETALRAASDAQQPRIAQALLDFAMGHESSAGQIVEFLLGLFRYVALSPYGNYVDRLLRMLMALAEYEVLGAARIMDVIATMLTQLCRHLTAFDLATFHNFGANYPDALYLDGLLKLYFSLIERQPQLLHVTAEPEPEPEPRARRLLRRGLRQGCLLRKRYEGLLVPDAPTSQGEAMRVLPEPFVRVPEEQISQPSRRRRRLFVGEPLEALLTPGVRNALQLSLADLHRPAELRELGTAFFLDRPLGVTKRPGEVDRTPLVSYTTVSREFIKRRLGELLANSWLSREEHDRLQQQLEQDVVCGVPVAELAVAERPGVVSLADALKVSADFIVVRSSSGEALRHYEWLVDRLPWPELSSEGDPQRTVLVHHAPRNAEPNLRVYDATGRLRLELGFELRSDGRVRFVECAGVELPARLQVVRLWEYVDTNEALVEREVRRENIWLHLRRR